MNDAIIRTSAMHESVAVSCFRPRSNAKRFDHGSEYSISNYGTNQKVKMPITLENFLTCDNIDRCGFMPVEISMFEIGIPYLVKTEQSLMDWQLVVDHELHANNYGCDPMAPLCDRSELPVHLASKLPTDDSKERVP